jgi:hypothetical protein
MASLSITESDHYTCRRIIADMRRAVRPIEPFAGSDARVLAVLLTTVILSREPIGERNDHEPGTLHTDHR